MTQTLYIKIFTQRSDVREKKLINVLKTFNFMKYYLMAFWNYQDYLGRYRVTLISEPDKANR